MGVLEEETKGKLASGCSILGKSLFSVITIIKIKQSPQFQIPIGALRIWNMSSKDKWGYHLI